MSSLNKAAASVKELPLLRLQKLMKLHGLNPSLPCAVFDSNGRLIGANRRMKALLPETIKLPIEIKEFESYWPFHNEHDAGPALLRKALSHRDAQHPWVVLAEGYLKTFRLQAHLCRLGKNAKGDDDRKADSENLSNAEFLIVAEIVRTGDLLGDIDSRQALFRTLSHEIRTSVMAMNGYLGILESQSHDLKIVQESTERMKSLVRRLESVVTRLDDFKVELGIFQNDAAAVPRKGR